jgi:hypothetical protein
MVCSFGVSDGFARPIEARTWGDEIVVYCYRSGDTHLLTGLAERFAERHERDLMAIGEINCRPGDAIAQSLNDVIERLL